MLIEPETVIATTARRPLLTARILTIAVQLFRTIARLGATVRCTPEQKPMQSHAWHQWAPPVHPYLAAGTDCGPRKVKLDCECCAVLFGGGPASQCGIVPMWDLEEWTCPDCSVAVESQLLCNRVIFNFAPVSSIDTESVYLSPRDPTDEELAGRTLCGH